MNVRPMRPDTANRIRPCAQIRHDGKVRFVQRVQLAPTKAHPERIRLYLSDLSGCLASKPEAVHLLAGDIVWQTWDPRIAGPTPDDLAETDPDDQTIHGLHIGDTVHVICGRTNRRIEDISLAAREVKVDGYWVSADRIEPAAKRPAKNATVALRRDKSWTGHVIRNDGAMTLVAWETGPLAGESKWSGTADLATVAA